MSMAIWGMPALRGGPLQARAAARRFECRVFGAFGKTYCVERVAPVVALNLRFRRIRPRSSSSLRCRLIAETERLQRDAIVFWHGLHCFVLLF